MRKLKEGDMLKKEGQSDKKILLIHGDLIFYNFIGALNSLVYCQTQKELEDGGWKLDEPDWEPEMNETFYVANSGVEDFFHESEWLNHDVDKIRYARGLCFKTKEEAIVKAKSMLNL